MARILLTVEADEHRRTLDLPDDEPFDLVLPEILRILGLDQWQQWRLAPRGGEPLDGRLSLRDQRIPTGTVVRLFRLEDPPTPPRPLLARLDRLHSGRRVQPEKPRAGRSGLTLHAAVVVSVVSARDARQSETVSALIATRFSEVTRSSVALLGRGGPVAGSPTELAERLAGLRSESGLVVVDSGGGADVELGQLALGLTDLLVVAAGAGDEARAAPAGLERLVSGSGPSTVLVLDGPARRAPAAGDDWRRSLGSRLLGAVDITSGGGLDELVALLAEDMVRRRLAGWTGA